MLLVSATWLFPFLSGPFVFFVVLTHFLSLGLFLGMLCMICSFTTVSGSDLVCYSYFGKITKTHG